MSRGMLDDSDWEKYGQELPDIDRLNDLINEIPTPDFLSIPILHNKSYQSQFPIASVCLNDTFEALWGAHYALFEIIAHDIWYMRKKDPPNQDAAALFGRFYADDAALRLYSAGEHLANGIIMMLEISDEDLKPFKNKEKRTSQQSIVGNYLRKEKNSHLITTAIVMLANSKEWRETMRYRGRLVHDQPPTVKGLGIVYKRGIRWEPSPTGKGHTLPGGGDKPEYSVSDLIQFIKPAISLFIDVFTSVTKYYKTETEELVNKWNNASSIKIRYSISRNSPKESIS